MILEVSNYIVGDYSVQRNVSPVEREHCKSLSCLQPIQLYHRSIANDLLRIESARPKLFPEFPYRAPNANVSEAVFVPAGNAMLLFNFPDSMSTRSSMVSSTVAIRFSVRMLESSGISEKLNPEIFPINSNLT